MTGKNLTAISNTVPPLIWERINDIFIPKGNAAYRCPLCKGDKHCYGIENPRKHNRCLACGAPLKYPEEIGEKSEN